MFWLVQASRLLDFLNPGLNILSAYMRYQYDLLDTSKFVTEINIS